MPLYFRSLAPWGKTEDGQSHHLAHHCADVAACFEAIISLPRFRSALEKAAGRPLDEVVFSRLSMLAFLHDVGKLHPGFQAKGWSDSRGLFLHGHTGEGLALFLKADEIKGGVGIKVAQHLRIREIAAWGVGESICNLLYAVFAHHGRPVSIASEHVNAWGDGQRVGYDLVAAAAEIGSLLPQWFTLAFEPGGASLPETPEFQHLFCGLVALADWLGSDQRQFQFSAELDPGYMAKARGRAGKAVCGIGLDTGIWRAFLPGDPSFAALAPGRVPREGQRAVGAWSLDDPLVILEAETGSGKTEAALWRFARLFAHGKVEGLYFAVPTRAAAKQLHGRVHAAMMALFGTEAPQTVLAVPGYLKAGMHEAQALPQFKVLWDDAPDDAQQLSRWAAESARRFLLAPVAVGTVDQAMLAALQVKHAHLRGAALARSLLVIDEVHASDGYMTEIQAALLDMHLQRGGHAMLMSATLGSAARTRWRGGRRSACPALTDAISTPYPAVWGKTSAMLPVAREGQDKSVSMQLAASWSAAEAARNAIAAASAGARVLVIRNTVNAALATFEAVRERAGDTLLLAVGEKPALHHSRFALEDRTRLDDAVEAVLSPDPRKRYSGGVIVIGTQTLEQSLDIDADFMITDLCPVDVLLQRIGRLHRHTLPRPAGCETPRCLVLAPEGGLEPFTAPKFENGIGMFRDGGGVYHNLHACELTRRLIGAHSEWVIPAMNRFLVESATHPEAIEALNDEKGRGWAAYLDTIYGKDLAEVQAGKGVRLDVRQPFAEMNFVSDEERIRTRIGAEGARIEFTPGTLGPFGGEISFISCPAHWKGITPEGPVTPERSADGWLRFKLGEQLLVYGHTGLERGEA